MKPLALTTLLLCACATDLLNAPPDGGGSDGATAPDLSHAQSCGDISAAVSEWLGEHMDCKTDADCTTLTTSCGLPGMCGTIANTAASGPQLQSLLDEWNHMACAQACACPAHPPPQPGCVDGMCANKSSPGPVGAPCITNADCQTGDCFTGWPGGYCTVEGCLAKGGACPSGSFCRDAGINNAGMCLASCALAGAGQCRNAYACCNGPGAGTGPAGCVPSMSFICQP